MNRLRRTSTIASVLVLATIAAPLVSPAASAASAKTHRYVGLVLGNSHYLVYSTSTASGAAGRYPHVLTRNGDRHRLTGTPAGTALTNASLQGTSLVGQAETAATGPDQTKVYWWNVKTRTSGTTALPSRGVLIGAAPGGFVYEVVSSTDVEQSTYFLEDVVANTATQLAVPSGDIAQVVAGLKGFVAYRDTKPADFVDPMTYVTYDGKQSADLKVPKIPTDNLAFASMSSYYLTAVNRGGDGESYQGVMIPLNGKKSTTLPGSRGYQVGHRILFGKNRPKWLSASGKVTKSKVKGRVVGTAFGAALVLNKVGTKLRSVANAKSKPKMLIATK